MQLTSMSGNMVLKVMSRLLSTTMVKPSACMYAIRSRAEHQADHDRPSAMWTVTGRRCKHTSGERDNISIRRRTVNPASARKENLESEAGTSTSASKVMLLSLSNKQIGLMSFADAQRVARQKDLKLVQMDNSSSSNSSKDRDQLTYKLMTHGVQAVHDQLHEEQRSHKKRQQITSTEGAALQTSSGALITKGVKMLQVGGKIEKHDLQVRMKMIQRWLQKGHVVKVTINMDPRATCNTEGVFLDLEKAADEVGGHVLQKRMENDACTLKFTLQMSKKKVEAIRKKMQAEGVVDDEKIE